MIELPQNGFCVDAECRGNPGPSRFQIFDLNEKKIIARGEQFFATNNVAEFIGLCNAMFLCLKTGEQDLLTDSNTAISWVRKGSVKTTMGMNEKTAPVWERITKCTTWLRTLKYNGDNCSFANDDGNIVFVHKWETSEWGEIPADFGNKR